MYKHVNEGIKELAKVGADKLERLRIADCREDALRMRRITKGGSSAYRGGIYSNGPGEYCVLSQYRHDGVVPTRRMRAVRSARTGVFCRHADVHPTVDVHP